MRRLLSIAALLALAVPPAGGRVRVTSAPSDQLTATATARPAGRHTFILGTNDFLLDGKPLQIISGEMHPARIPAEYWRHRIRMARAMGCNTIAAYIFWNYQEPSEGRFDFTTGNHDVARFIRTAQEEGMWVLLRPGPYVCAEWDFGGLPPYLLRDPELKVRCLYPRYTAAVERYLARLADLVRPLLVENGGPILMIQIENEYGSYGNDRAYTAWLKETWLRNRIPGPFFTADGPTPHMLEAGRVPGAAVGLDSGSNEKDWGLARSLAPGVPIFSSETYPGWLTHWGEKWARPSVPNLLKEVTFLLGATKSFNFYVVHGGTNFGFTAGANAGGKGYEPDVTSYDYDAPIDEQGRATPKYQALHDLIASNLPAGTALPEVPPPVPAVIVPEFAMTRAASVWEHLPRPAMSVQPRPFEMYGQNQGLMLYRTTLVGRKSGRLTITDLHDYATVFLDGKYVGALDRRVGEKTIELPKTDSAMPVLDILVEAMGHINFAQEMIDRKGITDRVTLSGMTLMNWQVFPLPLTEEWVRREIVEGSHDARSAAIDNRPIRDDAFRPAVFFEGTFRLDAPADTFIDMTGYQKGVVWVNGHNLGRYWDIGPQMRLYCPAPWLKAGANRVVVFDLHKTDPSPLRGAATRDQ